MKTVYITLWGENDKIIVLPQATYALAQEVAAEVAARLPSDQLVYWGGVAYKGKFWPNDLLDIEQFKNMASGRLRGLKRAKTIKPVLSAQAKQEYLKNPIACPFCKSQEVMGDAIDVDGTGCSQPIHCVQCGRRWYDIYTLTDILLA
jgi:hypothetical protein